MQAIKEKLNDMNEMRKARAEAKEEEKAEKELAKTRLEVAHEVRLAKEAEAAMDLHIARAAEKMAEHEQKHRQLSSGSGRDCMALPAEDKYMQDSQGRIISISPVPVYNLSDRMSGGGASISLPRDNQAWTLLHRKSKRLTAAAATYTDGRPNQILL
ncbi:UNVERIFIED_CONTAM: hypothetical protein Slati_3675800 [Sesamum latifolium]|uniref:Uncharacterized protein n=1 Tax=Sesamum latifolium TaxID=2727402 RepID=A0AAW2U5H1_9LAMI